jgi:hypothetical protein
MLPGGSGFVSFILGHLDWQGTTCFPPASRVSISEVLGGEKLDCNMEMA